MLNQINLPDKRQLPQHSNASNAVQTSVNERHAEPAIGTPSKFMNHKESEPQSSEGKRILTFIGCVCMIYLCQIINGVVEERIYKVPYKNSSSSSSDFYTDALTPMVFSSFFAAAIGYMKLEDHELELEIPMKNLLKLVALEVVIHFSLMWALMNASYILVVMANSCGLLSVIIVGVYFAKSRNHQSYQPHDEIQASDNQQNQQTQQEQIRNAPQNSRRSNTQSLGPQKILICLIVCVGIFVFNYFSPSKKSHSDPTAQSASLLTFAVLGFAIVLEGFRPQFQTQIKQEFQPSHVCFYFHYNKVQCIVVLALSLLSLQLPYTVNFILDHDELFLHIILLSLLNAISAMFIYKIITMFRQHVYPLVSTVRKCITVGVSILYFGHHITFAQMIGILLVFGGVMLQISMNYKLLQKWDINLPFSSQEKQQRYVKNKQFKNLQNIHSITKKYQVYKILDKDADIEGI